MSNILYSQLVVKYEKEIIAKAMPFAQFVQKFISRNSNALSMRGPSKRIPFTEQDRSEFFRLMGINQSDIVKAIKDCPLIDQKWNVLASTMNILLVSMVYVYYKNKELFKSYKYKPHYLATFYLALKFYSSIQYRQFPYLPDESIMEYTIEELSKKFLMKKFNTIFELVQYFSDSHVENMNMELLKPDDKNMTFYVSNLHTRISSAMKNITNEFMKNHENSKRTETSTLTSEDEDGDTYLNDIRSISADIEMVSRKIRIHMVTDGGVDQALLKIAGDKMHISPSKMQVMIERIQEDKNSNDVFLLVSNIIAYYLTSTKRDIRSIRSSHFIETMKNVYGVSNTKNQYIIHIKEILDGIIERYSTSYTKTMKRATLSNARGCIFLYTVLYISKYVE